MVAVLAVAVPVAMPVPMPAMPMPVGDRSMGMTRRAGGDEARRAEAEGEEGHEEERSEGGRSHGPPILSVPQALGEQQETEPQRQGLEHAARGQEDRERQQVAGHETVVLPEEEGSRLAPTSGPLAQEGASV